ncbi:MAG: glucose-6-phosphate dehydrogenase [Pyrinomonadaceae bacterium]
MPKESANNNPQPAAISPMHTPPPCALVIFGASGDLTKRKLVPALYHLAQQKLLPEHFAVIGTARTPMSDDEFRQKMHDSIIEFSGDKKIDEALWKEFAAGLFYIAGEFDSPETYNQLQDKLADVDRERKTDGNRIFYLSTAPSVFGLIAKQLGAANLARPAEGKWTRVVVEKPFGHDLASARALNAELAEVFDEEQVYRIDHYLGKETVQNLLTFRFANSIFEPLWNRQYIDHVQITNAETVGVEGRGGYYEESGVVRDMIQNHIFQIVALVAMEPPASLSANAVRDEKIKAMQSVRAIPMDRVKDFAVRGQYGAGAINGQPVIGYREEPDVNPQSSTETFAAVKLFFDSWRWADVPFYIRSGKRLPKRITEIAIQFKNVPRQLFTQAQAPVEPDVLVVRIQPNEGITLRFGAKLPGQAMNVRSVNMDFRYGASFNTPSPEAYERLLHDCMIGDPTLYARRDMTERGWEIVTPIIEAWKQPATGFPNYEAGTWGPQASHDFIERDNKRWRRL